jgi:hypothetical protein
VVYGSVLQLLELNFTQWVLCHASVGQQLPHEHALASSVSRYEIYAMCLHVVNFHFFHWLGAFVSSFHEEESHVTVLRPVDVEKKE